MLKVKRHTGSALLGKVFVLFSFTCKGPTSEFMCLSIQIVSKPGSAFPCCAPGNSPATAILRSSKHKPCDNLEVISNCVFHYSAGSGRRPECMMMTRPTEFTTSVSTVPAYIKNKENPQLDLQSLPVFSSSNTCGQGPFATPT
jgi:hypothetical protein